MKLRHWSVAAKLYSIFALLASVTVVLAVVAVVNARHHAALTGEFRAAFNGAQNVERVNGLVNAAEMESRGVYLARDLDDAKNPAAELALIDGEMVEVMREWRRLERPGDAGRFRDLSDRVQAFWEFRRELGRLASIAGPTAARAWGESQRNAITRTTLTNDLETLAKLYAQRSQEIYAKIESSIRFTGLLMTALAVLAIVLAGIGADLIRRAVAQPLARITQVTAAVAAGNADVAVPYGNRRDEVGALARSIGVFQDAMRQNEELSRTIIEDAQSRARRQEQISAEIVMFGADMAQTLADLGRISDQMAATSGQLLSAADTASCTTECASAASADASANVRDIASAADELAASVGEIDRQVTQANAIATKAVVEAESTNATVRELDEAAGRIGDVLKLITDIAEQTNLLALNATIEAARAGEAGRGFAVVASEVKALSGQTAKATEDIRAQIAGMQQATMRSITAIGAIERTIREIGGISGAIAAAVTEQGAATQEIARGVETAAQRTSETAEEVMRVGEATAATRDNAGAVKTVADDLGAVAAQLRGQVDTFFQKLRAA